MVESNSDFRRLFRWALGAAILLVAVLALPTTAKALPRFEEAIITGDDVNMRLRPTVDSPVVLKFSESTRVGVFSEENEDWYRIIYGNYRGYVNKDYVFLSSTDVLVGHVLTDGLNVYKSPADYSESITKLSVGTGVTIKNVMDDYYEVEYDEGKTGYVKKDKVQPSSSKKPVTLLKKGMRGVEVKRMQTELRKRGFMGASVTGEFGDQTEEALKDFQKAAKINADGVAGEGTLELLYAENDIRTNAAKKAGITGKVELTPWDEVKGILKRGTECKITDVETGISYNARRFGGWFHADSEPLTKSDTAKLKEISGGTWSWNRRAVWVTVGGRTFAASQHTMPHLSSPISTNGFDGHFCLHFYKSMVHETSKECPRHQAMVRKAYNAAK